MASSRTIFLKPEVGSKRPSTLTSFGESSYFMYDDSSLIKGTMNGRFLALSVEQFGVGGTTSIDGVEAHKPVKQVFHAEAAFKWSPGTSFGGTASTSVSSGTWNVSSNWVDLMLCILTSPASTDDPYQDSNNYDASYGNWCCLPPGYGAGIPISKIDLASFLGVKERTPHYNFKGFYYGSDVRSLRDLLSDTFLKPIGAYLIWSNGKLTLVLPRLPAPDETLDFQLTVNNILRDADGVTPSLRYRITKEFVAANVKYEVRSQSGHKSVLNINNTQLQATIGQNNNYATSFESLEFEVPHVIIDGNEGAGFLEEAAHRRILRFARPTADITCDIDFQFYSAYPGSVGSITLARAIPDLGTGTRGVTDMLVEMIERELHMEQDGRLFWRVRLIAYATGRPTVRLSPSARVTSVATNTATVEASEFSLDYALDTILTNPDADAFQVNDVVRLKNEDGSSASASTQIVQSISSNDITLDGNFGGALAANTFLVYAKYTECTATQKTNFAFQADSDTNEVTTNVAAFIFGDA